MPTFYCTVFAKYLTRKEIPRPFVQEQGSIEERLNNLYNQMKYAESQIENARLIEGATVSVWLTNDGLRSTDALLTYSETADILRDLAKWANVLVDPREMGDKLRQSVPSD